MNRFSSKIGNILNYCTQHRCGRHFFFHLSTETLQIFFRFVIMTKRRPIFLFARQEVSREQSRQLSTLQIDFKWLVYKSCCSLLVICRAHYLFTSLTHTHTHTNSNQLIFISGFRKPLEISLAEDPTEVTACANNSIMIISQTLHLQPQVAVVEN